MKGTGLKGACAGVLAAMATGTIPCRAGVTVKDFGPDGVGGYPVLVARDVKGPARIRLSYATHPKGLGPKGDFWHETRATYLGEEVDLPILPASTDRFDIFDVPTNGIYRAPLQQGLVRYVRIEIETGDAAVEVRFENRGTHSEEPVVGSFSCSDERVNGVWRASVRTCSLAAIPARTEPLHVVTAKTNVVLGTSHAYLSDGAKRDRLVWSGDLWWAQRNMYVAFASDSPYMPGSIRMMAENRTPSGYVQACPYPESHGPLAEGDWGPFGSDEFAAWFVPVLWDHYLHTADEASLRAGWPATVGLMAYLGRHQGADGIFEQRKETCKHAAGLRFGGTSLHHRAFMNILLWKTYVDAACLAEAKGENGLAARWRESARRLADSVRARFWDGARGFFRLSAEEDRLGFEANALALATRFATPEEADRILPHLKRDAHGKFQALAARGAFEYGRAEKAMELVAAHNWYGILAPDWAGMRTTQECMNLHTGGWGDEAHPDTAIAGMFTNYLLGVEPLEPGYRRFRIRPRPTATVVSAKGRVPTPHGFVEVEWHLEAGRPKVRFTAPPGTEGVVETEPPPASR